MISVLTLFVIIMVSVLITRIATVAPLLTFLAGHGVTVKRMVILSVALIVAWLFASSRWVDRGLSRIIDRALKRWTGLDVRDSVRLLQLAGAYSVMELEVEEDDWVADCTLAALSLRDEGIVVLGVERREGPEGDEAHRQAVAQQAGGAGSRERGGRGKESRSGRPGGRA